MSAIDPETRSPRSAVRYRRATTSNQPVRQSPQPTIQRASLRPRADAAFTDRRVLPDDLDTEEDVQRAPVPFQRKTEPQQAIRRPHPLFLISASMLGCLLLVIGGTSLFNWGTNEFNTLRYGYPRTFQIDAIVGNGDSAQRPTHFLALNLRGVILVEEFPGSDPVKPLTFTITALGAVNDLDPVTLAFINPDHNAYPDLVVTVDGTQNILYNDHGTFRTPTTAEAQQLLQFLQLAGN
jgi:hypothetical protein